MDDVIGSSSVRLAGFALPAAALFWLLASRSKAVDPSADRKAWFAQAPVPRNPDISLKGRTIVVTGATAGIGYETCLHLLRQGASTLVLGVRNVSKGKEARANMLNDAEVQRFNKGADIKVLEVDLESFESVKQFAKNVGDGVSRLDLLLLNAGRNVGHFEKTGDGHEVLFQTNFLSNALLSLLLLPLLQKTSSSLPKDATYTPTITWVGSMAHQLHSLAKNPPAPCSGIIEHFDVEAQHSKVFRYCDTKLLVALWVRAMAAQVAGPGSPGGVVINNLCPGTVATGFDKDLPTWIWIPMALNRYLTARSVTEGARTLVYAAVVAGDASHGQYIQDNKITPLDPYADTAEGKRVQEMLWTECLAEFGRLDGRVNAGLEVL